MLKLILFVLSIFKSRKSEICEHVELRRRTYVFGVLLVSRRHPHPQQLAGYKIRFILDIIVSCSFDTKNATYNWSLCIFAAATKGTEYTLSFRRKDTTVSWMIPIVAS